MEFIINGLRRIFFTLDSVVYGLIPSVYALLIQISRTSIFTQVEINTFAKRIYALIGVFMLFKVTVSIINYILNPDDFIDKEKGFTNIIKRILLSLVMLVLCPYIFQEAFTLQSIILEENTIMNLVFGNPSKDYGELYGDDSKHSSNNTYVDQAGRKIQFTLMFAFAQPNYAEFTGSNYDLTECRNTYKKDAEYNYVFRASDVTSSGQSRYIYELHEGCWGTYNPSTGMYSGGTLNRLFTDEGLGNEFQNYAQGVAQQSFAMFFRKEVITAKDSNDGRYFINYRLGISTAVGVATLYLFLMFCVDIAIRSIQWGFLQLIAPIPILSYCDPKSGKDGMFKKWFDKCKKVYLDLFIRLFALYFGIYIITFIGTFRDVATGEEISMMDNWLLSIFMILGVLMFVKKLPEFLKETLALDGSGMFKGYMNPLKRIEDEAIGGKAISGAVKKTAGVATGAVAGLGAGVLTGRGVVAGMKAGIAGGWKGDKFGKNWASSYSAGKERSKFLAERRADGVSGLDVFGDKVYNATHPRTRTDQIKQASDRYKAIQDTYKNYEGTAAGVDALAKDIQHRLDAAKAAGDHGKIEQYSKLFDARIKELAQNGGKVVSKMDGVNASTLTVDSRTGTIDWAAAGKTDGFNGIRATDGKVEVNAALSNYAQSMQNLADALNSSAVGHIAGATTITANVASDIKGVKNQAQGNQQSIDSNAENIKRQDVEKYSGGKKK